MPFIISVNIFGSLFYLRTLGACKRKSSWWTIIEI